MSNIKIQERETGNRTLISTLILSPTAQSDATVYVQVHVGVRVLSASPAQSLSPCNNYRID